MKKIFPFLLLISTYAGFSQDQIWKAIRTSKNQFSSSRDGQEIAWLREAQKAYAIGGWYNNDSLFNEVYRSDNKGQSWNVINNGSWPKAHDFLFASSVTGDTLVKWGGDGATNPLGISRRIDIYSLKSGWQNINPDYGEFFNDGIMLTGCRHKSYYYMLGSNGRLSRFTLENPNPEFVAAITGEKNIIAGFMLSLPNGRLLLGGGYCLSDNEKYQGKIWYSDDDGFTWNLLMQNPILKSYWPAAVVTKSAVIYWAGRDNSPASGLKGVYWIPIKNLEQGVDLNDWTLLEYSPEPRHAQGLCVVIDSSGNLTDEAIGVTGNHFNDSWLFKRIDLPASETIKIMYPDTLNFCHQSNNTYKLPAVAILNSHGYKSISYHLEGATNESGVGPSPSNLLLPGNTTLTWKVVDLDGNETILRTIIKVADPLKVEIPDFVAVTNGLLNTGYIGYEPEVVLKGNVSGGFQPYMFRWSNDAIASSIVVSNLPGTYTYDLNISDSIGCKSSATKQIHFIDIRCGSLNDKVSICLKQNNQVIQNCVSVNAVPALLTNGAILGECANILNTRENKNPDVDISNDILITVSPNPTTTYFYVGIKTSENSSITYALYNSSGAVLESKKDINQLGFKIGENLVNGLYILEIIQGNRKWINKLIKL